MTTAPEPPGPTPAPRRARFGALPRLMVFSLLALIALATTIGLIAFTLLNRTPHWWESVDASNPQVRNLAEQVEHGLVNTFHRGRPADEQWTVSLTAEQANAWLNVKLPIWMANQERPWPPRLREVQIHFSDIGLSFGARVRGPDRDRIVAATVQPHIDEAGAVWIHSMSAQAGQLDLPAGWSIEQLREWLPDEVGRNYSSQQLLNALAGESPLFPTASMKLNDGRRVRLVSIRPEDGRLLLTCVTERPITDGESD